MSDRQTQKMSYTKEYRTLLEKLLEIHCRLTELKSDKRLQAKLDPLIDKLLYYFNHQVDKTIAIHKQFDERWDNGETDDYPASK